MKQATIKRIASGVFPVILLLFILMPLQPYLRIIAAVALVFWAVRVGIPYYCLIRANRANREGNTEDVLKWFAKADKSGRMKPRHRIAYAYFQLKKGAADEAEALLDRTESGLEGDSSEYRLAETYRSMVFWQRGDLDTAAELLENLLAQGYRTTVLYGNLVFYLIKKGDLEEAEKLNAEALDFDNENKVILDNAGFLAYLQGRYDEALVLYEKLIPLVPSFPDAYYNYGLVLHQLGKQEEAIKQLDKALEFHFNGLTTIKREDIEEKQVLWQA